MERRNGSILDGATVTRVADTDKAATHTGPVIRAHVSLLVLGAIIGGSCAVVVIPAVPAEALLTNGTAAAVEVGVALTIAVVNTSSPSRAFYELSRPVHAAL